MKQQPEIVIPDSIPVVPIATTHTTNGVALHALVVDADVVRVSFVFAAGTAHQDVAFSASSTVNLLSEGTQNMTAKRISEQLDFYGSHFDVTIDRDSAVVSFCALSKFFEQTMEVARQILLQPIFPHEEVEIYASKRKEALTLERTKVSFRSRELFSEALFGADHPYGFSSPVGGYDALRREDIQHFYRRFYTAQNCFVVLSGRVDEHVLDVVGSIASQLPDGQAPKMIIPPASPQRYLFEHHQGALQSSLRIGLPLFNRGHEDYIPMQMVASVLGGYFGSRLVHNLREERGYTYGIFAAMVNLDESGYMAIGTEVATETTEDSLKQIMLEIDRLHRELISPTELRTVKNIMAGEVMRILDGPFGIADVAIDNILNGTDNSYTSYFVQQVKGMTAQRLAQVAQQYLVAEKMVTVVVGEKSMM